MRRAQLFDGTILEFPDETPDSVIDSTVKRITAEGQTQPQADASLTFQQGAPAQQPQAVQEPSFSQRVSDVGQDVLGAGEAGLTVATSIPAEVAAGLGGAITAPFIGSERAEDVIDRTREFFTFEPRTEAGQESLQSVQETLAPVGEFFSEAEKSVGDKAFELTGSPAIAAFATTLPTIASELVGAGLFKGAAKVGRARTAKKFEKEVDNLINKAEITPDQLKGVSSGIFREIEDLGVSVRPQKYQNLVAQIRAQMGGALDVKNTPKSNRVLNRMKEFEGRPVTLSEISNLRTFAKTASKATEPAEQRLGNIIIDNIDTFLTRSPENIFDKPAGLKVDISERYRVARNLWGRFRKSELIDEIFDNATLTPGNIESELRSSFKTILKNRKPKGKRQFFNAAEIRAMEEIVKGTKKGNFARALGALGFSPNQTTLTVAQLIGGGGGFFFLGGIKGAIGLAALGTTAKYVSRLVTEGKVNTLNAFIKAGPDARRLTAAYIKNTPVKNRSPRELGELLTGEGVDLSRAPRNDFVDSAVEIAAENRRAILRGTATSEIAREQGTRGEELAIAPQAGGQ